MLDDLGIALVLLGDVRSPLLLAGILLHLLLRLLLALLGLLGGMLNRVAPAS